MNIGTVILDRLPSGTVILCAVIAVGVPMLLYWLSDLIHSNGDPPWKKS